MIPAHLPNVSIETNPRGGLVVVVPNMPGMNMRWDEKEQAWVLLLVIK